MSSSGDAPREMIGHLYLDADTEERLLAGRVAPADAPPGYAEVAAFLRGLGRLPSSDTTVGEETIRTMAMMLRADRDAPPNRSRRKRLVARLTVVALATSLFGTTGAAFAGVLPDPVQSFAAEVLSRIGISVPTPAPEVADRSDDPHVVRPSESTPSPGRSPSSDGRNRARPLPPDAHDGGREPGRPEGEAPEVARNAESDEGSPRAESSTQLPVLVGAGTGTAQAASGGHGQGGDSADRASEHGMDAASEHQHASGRPATVRWS